MYKRPRWVDRTIRNGRVKIYGKWFSPDNAYDQYDGRLDGMRYTFALYYNSEGYIPAEEREFLPFAFMHSRSDQTWDGDGNPTLPEPEVVDGGYSWAYWREDGYENRLTWVNEQRARIGREPIYEF